MRRYTTRFFFASLVSAPFLEAACSRRTVNIPPIPPPLPASAKSAVPPPPPLPGGAHFQHAAGVTPVGTIPWKSPPEVLAIFVEYVPTFHVPVNCVVATLSDEARALVRKTRPHQFFRKYRFYFDVKQVDGSRYDVKLRADVSHPRKGAADSKYEMTDIGTEATFTVRPECVEMPESAPERSVSLKPHQPPPSVQVRLEERLPVLERLKALIPLEFTNVEELEENVPEDILFHPYFNCQGGLSAIAMKFPDLFQIVDRQIRIRPSHLAPMATQEYSFETSPEPNVIEKVKAAVCASEVPQWVSITSLYEQLSIEQRRIIKRTFKSFAGFLRAHGKSLAVSADTLSVSRWDAKKEKQPDKAEAVSSSESNTEETKKSSGSEMDSNSMPDPVNGVVGEKVVKVQYTQTHLLNELYEKFPVNKSLSVVETIRLLSPEMHSSLPKNFVGWLHGNASYFMVEGYGETDMSRIFIRRASDAVPLDVAHCLYPYIPDEGIAVVKLLALVPSHIREHIERCGLNNILNSLEDWIQLLDGDIFRQRSMEELESTIQNEQSKTLKRQQREQEEERNESMK